MLTLRYAVVLGWFTQAFEMSLITVRIPLHMRRAVADMNAWLPPKLNMIRFIFKMTVSFRKEIRYGILVEQHHL